MSDGKCSIVAMQVTIVEVKNNVEYVKVLRSGSLDAFYMVIQIIIICASMRKIIEK